MRVSFVKIGKKATVVAAMALLTTTTSFIPAEAAAKAGARCTKEGAKARIGGDRYVCTKNPTVRNARLTWVWVGCTIANREYLDSIVALEQARDKFASASIMIDQDIKALNDKKPEFEARAIELEKKAATWKSKAAAATTEANQLKTRLDSAGFKVVIDETYVKDLRDVLKPPVDTTISAADVLRLTTKWNTTADKLNLYYSAIEEFSLRESAENFLQGEKNALTSAADIRGEIAKQVALKEKLKVNLSRDVSTFASEVNAKKSTRRMACTSGL